MDVLDGTLPSSRAAAAGTTTSIPGPPKLQQSIRLDDSIRAVVLGPLTTPGVHELVVETFTGHLSCITPEGWLEYDEKDAHGRSKAAKQKG